jgi:hypothetical protein
MFDLSQAELSAALITGPLTAIVILVLVFVSVLSFGPSMYTKQETTPTRCHAAIRELVAYKCTAGENECNHLKEALLQWTVQECQVE